MQDLSQSKFHKGFYKLSVGSEEVMVSNKNGEVLGVWVPIERYGYYTSPKGDIKESIEEIGRYGASTSQKNTIWSSGGEVKVWSLEELGFKFGQVDAEVRPIVELEHKEKCKKCGKEAEGFLEEITESDGFCRFEVCMSCAKKTRSKITLYKTNG